jgi:putative ABC transport system permease protein
MEKVSTGFSVLSLVITVLGLFALSSFIVQRRLKEIGMRKVLGATNMKIVIHFSFGFARLISVSFLMAIPVAYLVIRNILLAYSYRISIPIWAFPLAGVLCGVFALLIVGIKVYRASYYNSISTLRSE